MTKQFSEIKFEMAENLPENLKAISPKKEGLVAVKSSINSLPMYEIDEVDSPTAYLKKLGIEQGITQEVLNEGFSGAFIGED